MTVIATDTDAPEFTGHDVSSQERDARGRFGHGLGPASSPGHAAAHAVIDAGLEGLSGHHRELYASAARHVIDALPAGAAAQFASLCKGMKFHTSEASCTEAFRSLGGSARTEIGGFCSREPYQDRCDVHIDSASGGHAVVVGVIRHELGHALDPQGKRSGGDWIDAYREEIDRPDAPLTQYARKNRREGWAEFARLAWDRPEQAKQQFPKCYAAFKSHGLVT